MCLQKVTTKYPKIAKKDIICYKVVIKTEDGNYLSIYRGCHCKLNTVLRDKHFQMCSVWNTVDLAFHTIKSLSRAKRIFQYKDIYILKATIPKDTRYYQGKFDDSVSYASEKIIYEEL